jgi:nucleoid DNA-binding protein
MNWKSQAGKSSLIKMLMKDHGVSKRKAEKAVNAIFSCMAQALCRGEEVELPVGWIQAVTPPRRKSWRFQKLRNIDSGKRFTKLLSLPKRIIRFRPDPQLIQRGPYPPAPPSPTTLSQFAEVKQLFLALTGIPLNKRDFNDLYRAADHDLPRLLARLRWLAQCGHAFRGEPWLPWRLAPTVHQLHWIRSLPKA